MGSGVLGVDFSGASAAGDALWVTEATQTAAGMCIDACYRATAEWGRDRESAHAGLVERIRDDDVGTVGLDFPFSLPQSLLDAQCGGHWRGFLEWVCSDSGPASSDGFSEACRHTAEMTAGKRDIRRETDARRAALCPYTNRVRSMTYHGARDVLGRLADDPDTAVAPMQGHDAETVVCEVYPAATFGWLGCYREGYKTTDGARARRETNVEAVAACSVDLGDHRETYHRNHDALDSLAAAVSAGRVADGARPTPVGTVEEGTIYV
ncbi:DUF429 domain-containing protein [Halomicroarcula sp. S1AR25-4]|uniref:DUF429 domain-containing protein n=1 Tax=Haloarcula sp. S1AR25-4 TaxID=2950538 RepID=UPI002876C9D4|nr:DUF429 domain-containing protein [Halomicroarcula sp. S1AR25-4]MDS0277408.1 DUF429 domain-containing protein [Halomicroarcula sp. S1AR25-4]